MSITSQYGPQNLAANGAVMGPVDTSSVRTVLAHFTAGFTGNVAYEQSVDGANWIPANGVAVNSVSNTAQNTSTNPGTGVAVVLAVPGNFFRVRVTAYTSGTAVVRLALIPESVAPHTMGVVLTNAAGSNAGSGVSAPVFTLGNTPQTSNNAATVVSAGTAIDLGATRANHTIQVLGTFVAGNVRLQGSLDTTNFVDVVVYNVTDTTRAPVLDITAPGIYATFSPTPLRTLRGNLTAITSGSVTTRIASY